ncbi:MAG: HD-GYP domain-containing protein [Thermoleophilia bacterium]
MNEAGLSYPQDGQYQMAVDNPVVAGRWSARPNLAAISALAALVLLAIVEVTGYRLAGIQDVIFVGYFIPIAIAARFLSMRWAATVTIATVLTYVTALMPHIYYFGSGVEIAVELTSRSLLFAATGIGLSWFRHSNILERERALAAENERTERLSLMVDVSSTIASSLKIEEVLQVLSDRIVQAVEASFCMVALLDDREDSLRVVAAHPIRDDLEWNAYIGQSLPLVNLPDFRRAIEAREMVIVGGIHEDIGRMMPVSERSIMSKAKSVMLFPLVVSDVARGVVCIGEQRSWERSPMDLERSDLCQAIVNQGAVAVGHALTHEAVAEAFSGTIRALAETIDAKDPSTRGHSDWVSRYALMIGRALDLDDEKLEYLKYAGYLHDIGKIGIPDELLRKPEQLSEEEWRLMKKHPLGSSKILEPVQLSVVIKDAVRHHHERFDGKGYPYGLSGKAIPLESRILAVADSFEAMTADRYYRKALSDEQAVAELKRCAGSQFDPDIVEALLRALGRDSLFEDSREGFVGTSAA